MLQYKWCPYENFTKTCCILCYDHQFFADILTPFALDCKLNIIYYTCLPFNIKRFLWKLSVSFAIRVSHHEGRPVMKFCIKCGQQASSDDQKFCRFCGTEFPAIVLSHAAEEDNHEKDFTSGDGPDIKGETIGKSTDDGDSSVKIFFQEKQKPQEPEKGQWSTPQAKSDEQKEENATDSVPPSETTSQVPLQTVDSCRDRPPFGRFKGKIIGIITALLILSCIAGFGGWFY